MTTHVVDPLAEDQGHVLVVEDDVKSRNLLRRMLLAQGYSVSWAGAGAEARQKVVEERPDVILLDVMLPDLDGYEVCRQLKGTPGTAAIPVIMVTALTDRAERLKGIEAGAADFISKPVDPEELLLRVRNGVRCRRLLGLAKRNVANAGTSAFVLELAPSRRAQWRRSSHAPTSWSRDTSYPASEVSICTAGRCENAAAWWKQERRLTLAADSSAVASWVNSASEGRDERAEEGLDGAGARDGR